MPQCSLSINLNRLGIPQNINKEIIINSLNQRFPNYYYYYYSEVKLSVSRHT